MYQHILQKVQHYVNELFKRNPNEKLVFHTLQHTQDVVKRSSEIGQHYNLKERENLVIIAAAWFHDVGHLFFAPEEHEEISAEIMKEFMTKQISDNELIGEIEACILATKFTTIPENLLQQILCDADTYHLGTTAFKLTNQRVFEEEKMKTHSSDRIAFDKGAIEMLQFHKYYTEYCKDLLNKEKAKNMQRLKRSLPNE